MVNSDPHHLTDEQLMVQFSSTGDTRFYDELYDRHFKSLLKTIRTRYTGDHSSAEDIVQDTFIKVFEHHADFNPKFSFRPWLCTIAIRYAINWLKSRGIRKAFSIEQGCKELPYSRRTQDVSLDDQEELDFLMSSLSPEKKLAVTAVYLHDQTFDDAAQETGVLVNTLKTQVTRAIRKLNKQVA